MVVFKSQEILSTLATRSWMLCRCRRIISLACPRTTRVKGGLQWAKLFRMQSSSINRRKVIRRRENLCGSLPLELIRLVWNCFTSTTVIRRSGMTRIVCTFSRITLRWEGSWWILSTGSGSTDLSSSSSWSTVSFWPLRVTDTAWKLTKSTSLLNGVKS